MSYTKGLLSQSLLVVLMRIVAAIAAFLMTLSISKSLAAEEAGLVFLAIAIYTVLGTVSTMGFTTSIVRSVASLSVKNNWPVIMGTFWGAITITCIFSIFLMILVFISTEFLSENIFENSGLSPVITGLVIALPLYVITQIISYAFQGLSRPFMSVYLLNISTQLMVVVITFFFVLFEVSLSAATLAQVYASAAALTFLIGLFFWLAQPQTKTKSDYSQLKEAVARARPIWGVNTMSTAVQWCGVLIVGAYVSSVEVAYFSVAQRLSLIVSVVLIAVNSVVAPRFAAIAQSKDNEELKNVFFYSTRILMYISIPVLAVTLILAPKLMLLFGDEYLEGAILLRILVLGQFFNVLSGSVGNVLNMAGFERDLRNAVAMSGVVAIGGCLILVPIFGSLGAAIAIAISVISRNFICVHYVNLRLGFNPLKMFSK